MGESVSEAPAHGSQEAKSAAMEADKPLDTFKIAVNKGGIWFLFGRNQEVKFGYDLLNARKLVAMIHEAIKEHEDLKYGPAEEK